METLLATAATGDEDVVAGMVPAAGVVAAFDVAVTVFSELPPLDGLTDCPQTETANGRNNAPAKHSWHRAVTPTKLNIDRTRTLDLQTRKEQIR